MSTGHHEHGEEPADSVISSDIEAEMIWTSPSAPPEVMLAFQGLAEPTGLWADLTTLGWNVPTCPPRPGSAIEWIPDPVAGTDYTIRPWRVKEFRLGEGAWSREVGATIGAATFHALRRHGALITGTQGPLEQIKAAMSDAPEVAPTHTAPNGDLANAGAVSSILFLDLDANLAAKDGVITWPAVIGRKKLEVSWTELGPNSGVDDATFSAMVDGSAGSWVIDSSLAKPAAGHKAIKMLVPDVTTADASLAKIVKKLGGMVTMHDLETVAPDGRRAVLLTGVVPAHSYDMLHSNLRLRVPAGVARLG